MRRQRPLSSRAAQRLGEREREAGLDPTDEAARWLHEHDPSPPPTLSRSKQKSKLLHQFEQRQRQEQARRRRDDGPSA